MINGLYWFARKWSEKGSVWIFSDTHFNDVDREVMGYEISSQEQFDILKRFVHKNDTLVHLGDVGDPKYFEKLPGYKVLILGNHDYTAKKFQPYFDEIYEGPLFISRKILLSHEPVYGLNCCFNIHGHDHSVNNIGDDHHLNLASNVCGYKPVSLGKLIKDGILADIKDIHRITIDNATEKKNDN